MKQSFLTALVAGIAGIGAAQDQATALNVSNVRLMQDVQTQFVTIQYDLENAGNPAIVRFDIETNGVSIGQKFFKSVTGDATPARSFKTVLPGNNKKIVWNAHADWAGNLVTNATAHVMAYYTNSIQLAELEGVYMVVDISGGHEADRFPVSYTFDAPDLSDTTCYSNKIWLKRIEKGTFTMGSPTNTPGRNAERETQHEVTLKHPFFAGVFPVTISQYQLVMGSIPVTNYYTYGTPSQFCPMTTVVSWNTLRGVYTNDSGVIERWPSSSNVVASTFMGLLRAKTLIEGFDLPTDAQWEYACRAGCTNDINSGYDLTNATADAHMDEVAWYKHTTSEKGLYPVGLKPMNNWGLYDMHGNVWEWCLDNSDALGGAEDPVGPAWTGSHIVRGGCFNFSANQCTSAYRNIRATDFAAGGFGFRLFCRLDK